MTLIDNFYVDILNNLPRLNCLTISLSTTSMMCPLLFFFCIQLLILFIRCLLMFLWAFTISKSCMSLMGSRNLFLSVLATQSRSVNLHSFRWAFYASILKQPSKLCFHYLLDCWSWKDLCWSCCTSKTIWWGFCRHSMWDFFDIFLILS